MENRAGAAGRAGEYLPSMTEPARSLESEPRDDFAAAVTLTSSTARRISHQIDRSVQGTYGAHDGLRELVHLGVQQMLVAGASRDMIHNEIAQCVTDRPPTLICTEPALSRHNAEMVALTRMMLGWADECPMPARPR